MNYRIFLEELYKRKVISKKVFESSLKKYEEQGHETKKV